MIQPTASGHSPHADHAELARRLNFSFVLPGRLAGLAWPFRRDTLPEATANLLQEAGVTLLVNLAGEPYSRFSRSALTSLRLVDMPIEDYEPPSLEQADELWRLFSALPDDQAMAVHCAAGVGRTGTMLACLLARERGLPADEAIALLRVLRPGSVETVVQEDFIAEWLARPIPA